MRLDLVDVFASTADNTPTAVMVRKWEHPPVRELGEADDR